MNPPLCPTCRAYAVELANLSFAWIAINDLAWLLEAARRQRKP